MKFETSVAESQILSALAWRYLSKSSFGSRYLSSQVDFRCCNSVISELLDGCWKISGASSNGEVLIIFSSLISIIIPSGLVALWLWLMVALVIVRDLAARVMATKRRRRLHPSLSVAPLTKVRLKGGLIPCDPRFWFQWASERSRRKTCLNSRPLDLWAEIRVTAFWSSEKIADFWMAVLVAWYLSRKSM